jgi:Reverse transcriptase (RNA-dependent DNA polymerase)
MGYLHETTFVSQLEYLMFCPFTFLLSHCETLYASSLLTVLCTTKGQALKEAVDASPTRRVWIPKPESEDKRPLSIPVLWDRAAQSLVKLALEPEWEAHFEPNSYGFRPGRSAQDAMVAIHGALHQRAKYVLDADIAQCIDRLQCKYSTNKL